MSHIDSTSYPIFSGFHNVSMNATDLKISNWELKRAWVTVKVNKFLNDNTFSQNLLHVFLFSNMSTFNSRFWFYGVPQTSLFLWYTSILVLRTFHFAVVSMLTLWNPLKIGYDLESMWLIGMVWLRGLLSVSETNESSRCGSRKNFELMSSWRLWRWDIPNASISSPRECLKATLCSQGQQCYITSNMVVSKVVPQNEEDAARRMFSGKFSVMTPHKLSL